ncbi:hypothetical protein A5876_003146, partial [Enterococcus sp. 3C8_DIV0646]
DSLFNYLLILHRLNQSNMSQWIINKTSIA